MLVRNWLFYYIILFSPVIDMLLAAFLTKIICHQSTWPHIFRYGLVGLALVIMVTSSLSKLPQSWGTSYDTVQSQLNATIQPDESILAAQTYWFGLSDHVYYSWQQLIYYRQQHTESGLQEALESLRPDILIIDDYLDKFISDEPFGTRYMEFLRLSRNEMNVFLYHRAKLVAVIEDKNYGTIRVFRISW